MWTIKKYEYQVKDFFFSNAGDEPMPFDRISLADSLQQYNYEGQREYLAAKCTALDADLDVKKLLSEYIYPRCSFQTIRVSWENQLTDEEKLNMFVSIVVWLSHTMEKHKEVIKAIKGIDDFMKTVDNETATIFNDTPQSPSPELDEHVTNYTKSVNKADMATPIARIDEIRTQYENELENWCNEFITTFIIM